MGTFKKVAAAAVVAVALSANTAQAQVNFSTTGAFSSAVIPGVGCNTVGPMGAMVATCTGGGFTLEYTGVPTQLVPYGNGSIVSLGTFRLTGSGNATALAGQVNFTLYITQTLPTAGTANYTGSVSGTVIFDGATNSSTLVWRPNGQLRNIGGATYNMIWDNAGPGADQGIGISVSTLQPTSINAVVSTVPEPSSVILMASGLIGLAGVAIRRRRSA